MTTNRKRIAYWMSEKKSQKINWDEFEAVSAKYGFELFKLNLDRSIQAQGPFHVLLHKLTDIIASAEQGDKHCSRIITSLEKYISTHDRLIVLDPIDKVRKLLDRHKTYSVLRTTDDGVVFTPNFCEITSHVPSSIAEQLRSANITYPFICKPRLGHGSKEAHKMLIVFNENGIGDCRAPCVAQSFVNHNAVLFKLFIVGERHYFQRRPSLKNFYACDNTESISFESSAVSKAGARSDLTLLEPHEENGDVVPDNAVLERITARMRRAFGMDLMGVDVVIENSTGRYAIIDVNVYPGYDSFPNFFDALLQCINKKVAARVTSANDKRRDGFKFPEEIGNENHQAILNTIV